MPLAQDSAAGIRSLGDPSPLVGVHGSLRAVAGDAIDPTGAADAVLSDAPRRRRRRRRSRRPACADALVTHRPRRGGARGTRSGRWPSVQPPTSTTVSGASGAPSSSTRTTSRCSRWLNGARADREHAGEVVARSRCDVDRCRRASGADVDARIDRTRHGPLAAGSRRCGRHEMTTSGANLADLMHTLDLSVLSRLAIGRHTAPSTCCLQKRSANALPAG